MGGQRLARVGMTLLVSLIAGAGVARGASFDCKRATAPIERQICADPDLDSLDAQLQGAYLGALDRSTHPQSIKDKQLAWLKSRASCPDAKCLVSAYRRQIDLLSALSDEPPVCSGSTTPEIDACAAEYSRRADADLSRYLAAAKKRLKSEVVEDQTGSTAKAALAGLETSQSAWERYRKAECDAVYAWWSDGTIRGAMFQGCWRAVTQDRTMAIWSSWLQFMDTTPPLLPKPGGQ